MTRKHAALTGVAATLLIGLTAASIAYAGTGSSKFTVKRIELDFYRDTVSVMPYEQSGMINPRGCGDDDWYELWTGRTTSDRNEAAILALSAMVGKLYMSATIATGSCSANDRPAFSALRVYAEND